MPAFTSHLAHWFHDHHGIATGADLLALGVTEDQRRGLLEAGVIAVLFEGVYRLVAMPLNLESRCAAVCAADQSLVISCFSAGSLDGLRRCGHRFIHATTDRFTKPISRGVRIHRSLLLPEEDIVRRADGIRLTSPARTWFDLAKHVGELALASIAEQLLDERKVTFQQLTETTQRMARPGRPGSSRALKVLASRPAAGNAADSHDEVVLLAALHAAGLTTFVRHPPVRLASGDVVHPDLGDPGIGFYIEVDHHTWHDGMSATDYDKDRDRQIRLVGGVVERVTETHIRSHLDRVVAEIHELHRTRLRSFGTLAG